VDAVGTSILVVEDDPSLRMLCRVNLELEHYRVREAATLDDARSAIAEERPALVFLDMHLGRTPSDELLDELRAAGIPVVLVSGTVDLIQYEGRADEILAKPFEPSELIAAARRHAVGYLGAPVAVAIIRSAAEFESRLSRYLFERSEESRAVRVGEKETSEQAEIVRRYEDLFSRPQLDALREAEQAASGDERERLYRLRKTCESGIASATLVEREDEFENRLLAARVTFRGDELPLRTAQAQLAVLAAYRDREELGEIHADASEGFNPDRLGLLSAEEELAADLSGIADAVERSEEEKGISLRELSTVLKAAADDSADAWEVLRSRWFEKLLGPERDEIPSSFHTSYMRRLSPLEATYTKDRATDVCLATLTELGFDLAAATNIKLDLDDRPQKDPRACVIASDPPNVVHLITRAQGGLHDYQAFLHEAGHALHYGGVDPRLPMTYRRLARDHALTEIYSYIVEAISREPGWHARHFSLADDQAAENAEATVFLEALLFRRYEAKLRYELGFWSRFAADGGTPDGYEEYLTSATGIRYARKGYLADMDGGFYSADYLRAWIRSAQLRRHLIDTVGEDWWCNSATGELLRGLFLEGTKPSSEEVAARIGYDPLDTAPLLHEIGA
jgi:DNA-binding response OmpR family regulator